MSFFNLIILLKKLITVELSFLDGRCIFDLNPVELIPLLLTKLYDHA